MVTGRILSEWKRVAGELRSVDAIVAENTVIVCVPLSYGTVMADDGTPSHRVGVHDTNRNDVKEIHGSSKHACSNLSWSRRAR